MSQVDKLLTMWNTGNFDGIENVLCEDFEIRMSTLHEQEQDQYITIKAERKNIRLALNEILWIRSLKDYIQIITSEKKFITQVPIGEMERQLPESLFLRIHRSYIVNISNVTAFTNLDVEINQMELPIGRSYRNLVISTLD